MGLAVHPSDAKRITMLTPTRAWLTSDGGVLWDSVTLPAPAEQGSLWLRGHGRDEVLLAVLGGRVFESPNFGRDWKSISGVCPSCTSVTARDPPYRCLDAIAGVTVHPIDPNTIYAGTIVSKSDGGVLVSTNNGDTWDWLAGNSTRRCQANSLVSTYRPGNIEIRPSSVCQPSNTFDNDGWPFAVDQHEPSIMIAGGPHPGIDGGGSGFKRSDTAGATWSRFTTPELCIERVSAMAPSSQEKYWIVSGQNTHESWNNEAAFWTKLDEVPGLGSVLFDTQGHVWGWSHAYGKGTGDLYFREYQPDADDEDRTIPPYGDWQKVSFAPGAPSTLAVRYENGTRVVLVGTDGSGLFRRVDSGPWELISTGVTSDIPVIEPRRLRKAGNNAVAAATKKSGVFIFSREEKTWRRLGPPFFRHLRDFSVSPAVDQALITDGAGTGIYYWSSGENLWVDLEIKIQSTISSQGRLLFARQHPRVPEQIAAVIHDGADNGYHFVRFERVGNLLEVDHTVRLVVKHRINRPDWGIFAVEDIVFDPQSPGTIYLATHVHGLNGTEGSGLQRSTDGGRSWTRVVISGTTSERRSVYQILLSNDGASLFVTVGASNFSADNAKRQLFFSPDGGGNFSEVNTELVRNGAGETGWLNTISVSADSRGNVIAHDWREAKDIPPRMKSRI